MGVCMGIWGAQFARRLQKIIVRYQSLDSINVSTGFLAHQIRKVSKALKQSYEELVQQLPTEEHLHVDETGAKKNGKKHWTWCFRSHRFTLFHIDSSRGSSVLEAFLGREYSGTLSCDFFGAYRKFARLSSASLQYCWSHLIREVKYLAESVITSLAVKNCLHSCSLAW